MWGQIKKAINSRLDTSLNEQNFKTEIRRLTIGGTTNILESVLIVEGKGVLHSLASTLLLGAAGENAFDLTVFADDELIAHRSNTAATPARFFLSAGRLDAFYSIVSVTEGGDEPEMLPLSFEKNLRIFVRKRNMLIGTTRQFIAHLWVDPGAAVIDSFRSGDFRRLIFDANTDFVVSDRIKNNTARLYMIGGGGSAPAINQTTMASNAAATWRPPGETAQIFNGNIPLQRNDTVAVRIGPGGVTIPSQRPTFVQISDQPEIRVIGGAQSNWNNRSTTPIPLYAKNPQPVEIFQGRGRGAPGDFSPDGCTEPLPLRVGTAGRVVIEYYVE